MDAEALEALRRHSHITLTADGTWRYHDAEVAHPRVQALFHRGVTVRADGEVVLTVGRMWCYVRCETVARFVDGLRVAAGGLTLRYRHGEAVTAPRPIVATGPDERFYLWSSERAEVAALSRAATGQLAGLIEEQAGAPVVRLGERVLPIVILAAIPGPGAPAPAGGGADYSC